MAAVRQWLKELRLGPYVESFEAEAEAAKSLSCLTDDDLKDASIKESKSPLNQ